MNIGLYFGSFNPIHTGHLILANHIINHTELDKIWFVVSPHNPLKNAHSLLNEYDRFHLVELAIEDNPHFKASNAEFSLPKPSYTVHTLAYLKEKFPFEKFTIIMGSDSYQNLPNWKNHEVIISDYTIIVYLRPEHPITAEVPPQVTVMEAPLLEISSSYIRSNIQSNKSIQYLVHDKVREYIQDNKYYK